MTWFSNFWPKPPSQINQPYVFGKGKPTRHNPQPNHAPRGKRKRQWK